MKTQTNMDKHKYFGPLKKQRTGVHANHVLYGLALIGFALLIALVAQFNLFLQELPVAEANERPTASQGLTTDAVDEPLFLCDLEMVDCNIESQIRAIATEADFPWIDYLVRLATCESKLDPNALGDSGQSRGLFQISRIYHPEVTDECAFDTECSTAWTMHRIENGYQHEWTCDRYI